MVLEQDHYVSHLNIVNITNTVTVSGDIVDAQGEVIVKKGTEVTPELAQQILSQSLQKPLDTSITLEQSIGADQLYKDLTALAESYQQFGASELLEVEKQALKQCCLHFGEYPLLMQKITVLAQQLPEVYKSSLVTSLISLRIAQELRLSHETLLMVYLGGLMRDVGMLHIDPVIVNKGSRYTAEEWDALQSHVLIGRQILDRVQGLNKKIGLAVFEHHERINGTGYPQGKSGSQLSLEGQIIAMADSANAIFHKKVQPKGYRVKDCLPVLQMVRHIYPADVINALLRVLNKNSHPPGRALSDNEVSNRTRFLIVCQKAFSHWFNLIQQFVTQNFDHLDQQRSQQLRLMLEQLESTIRTSGLFSNEFREWLESVVKSKNCESFQDVEYTLLMYDELAFQFHQLYKITLSISAQANDHQAQNRCHELGALLDTFPEV